MPTPSAMSAALTWELDHSQYEPVLCAKAARHIESLTRELAEARSLQKESTLAFGKLSGELIASRAATEMALTTAESALAAALAKQAESARDSARLDWLDRDDIEMMFGTNDRGGPFVLIRDKRGKMLAATGDIRSAIDAAIAKGGEGET